MAPTDDEELLLLKAFQEVSSSNQQWIYFEQILKISKIGVAVFV